MTTASVIVRRSARAVLLAQDGRLVVINRTKPGQAPYWTTPGGGVEPCDASREATVERELDEELGATVVVGQQVFLVSVPTADGVEVQYFYLCRLVDVDPAGRTGPEHDSASRAGYELDQVPLSEVTAIDLQPVELRDFILANRVALMADLPG